MEDPKGDKVLVAEDHAGEWRWQFVYANGEPGPDSGEGFRNRQHAIDRALEHNQGTPVYTLDEHAGGWVQVGA